MSSHFCFMVEKKGLTMHNVPPYMGPFMIGTSTIWATMKLFLNLFMPILFIIHASMLWMISILKVFIGDITTYDGIYDFTIAKGWLDFNEFPLCSWIGGSHKVNAYAYIYWISTLEFLVLSFVSASECNLMSSFSWLLHLAFLHPHVCVQ